MRRVVDRAGQTFGRLTAISLVRVEPSPVGAIWRCACSCSNFKEVQGNKLRVTKSCGCLLQEYRHGPKSHFPRVHAQSHTDHQPPSSLYNTWTGMISRCENPRNPSYRDYGGRGIRVCKRWRKSFVVFASDVGPKPSPQHTLDRKNTNGPYSPSNCRWATIKEQMRNRRSNVRITFQGQTKTLVEWCELTGLKRGTLNNRLRMGWSVADALFRPLARQVNYDHSHIS